MNIKKILVFMATCISLTGLIDARQFFLQKSGQDKTFTVDVRDYSSDDSIQKSFNDAIQERYPGATWSILLGGVRYDKSKLTKDLVTSRMFTDAPTLHFIVTVNAQRFLRNISGDQVIPVEFNAEGTDSDIRSSFNKAIQNYYPGKSWEIALGAKMYRPSDITAKFLNSDECKAAPFLKFTIDREQEKNIQEDAQVGAEKVDMPVLTVFNAEAAAPTTLLYLKNWANQKTITVHVNTLTDRTVQESIGQVIDQKYPGATWKLIVGGKIYKQNAITSDLITSDTVRKAPFIWIRIEMPIVSSTSLEEDRPAEALEKLDMLESPSMLLADSEAAVLADEAATLARNLSSTEQLILEAITERVGKFERQIKRSKQDAGTVNFLKSLKLRLPGFVFKSENGSSL